MSMTEDGRAPLFVLAAGGIDGAELAAVRYRGSRYAIPAAKIAAFRAR